MKRFAILLLTLCIIFTAFAPASTSASKNATQDEINGGIRVDLNAPAVPGELLVKFKPGTASKGQADAVAAAGKGQLVRTIEGLDIQVAYFPALAKSNGDTRATAQVLEALKRNPNVEFAEPNYIMSVNFTPNDSGYSQQWAWNVMDAPQAWDVTQGSTSVVVAIIDTGIQRNHPDLDSKIVAGYDFIQNDTAADDGNGHGTHVAGTVAAETNNAQGGAGTCPSCKLMPVRVLGNDGSGTMEGVANGIRWSADNGADVINMSLGGGGASTLQTAVDYAWGKGVFLACAAGNDNTSSQTNSYPGAYTNCFAVASTTNTDARSSFSNYGSWVEIAAPGSNIYSTWINSGYNTISGTSMATPHVAGVAGLLASQGLTNAQIRDRLCATAEDISGTGTYWTCGRLNANLAVTNGNGGGGTTPTPTPPPTQPSVLQNGGFESGTSPWVQNGPYALITNNKPRTGSYSVWMGGYNNANEGIYQTVTVPANGTLRYYWHMTSSEGTGTAYDYLRVRVYSTNGALLGTLRTWSNRNTRNVWSQDSLSLAAYAGQTVRIKFETTTDSSVTTSFYIDDVSMQ